MKKLTSFLFISSLALLASLTFNVCVAKMPAAYNSTTKTQYILTDVVNGIGTLQLAAENAVPSKILSLNSARSIVQFCVSANTTIGQTPKGWYPTVWVAYQQVKNQLTPTELQTFSGYLAAFEVVLNSFSPQIP